MMTEEKKIFVRIGQTYQSKHGEFEVVMIADARNLIVDFKETGSLVKSTVYRIRQGTVKDPAKIRKRKVSADVE